MESIQSFTLRVLSWLCGGITLAINLVFFSVVIYSLYQGYSLHNLSKFCLYDGVISIVGIVAAIILNKIVKRMEKK
jgi:hypothetical protein